MTATAYERIIDKLEEVKPNGDKARALCPAHDGTNPTALAIRRIEGSVLLYCHVGCTVEDILASLEMRKSDLYDDARGYDYHYADGAVAHRSYDHRGEKKFYQSGTIPGASTTLFRIEKVEPTKAAGQTIYLVEGEDDVLALESLGLTAVSGRGGAGGIHKVDFTPLYGANVIAIVDKDEAGDKWAKVVFANLMPHARVVFLKAAVGKDAADHIAAEKGVADFESYTMLPPQATPDDEPDPGRWLDLDQYLDGTYTRLSRL
jgi:putative DNA primase/helicase